MSFKDLKNNGSGFMDKLSDKIDNMNKFKREVDPNDWFPGVNAKGDGYAVVRFLPPAEGEDVPFVSWYEHSFQGPGGKWYIERCPTSIGKDDPLCQVNTKLWDTGLEANINIVKNRSRQYKYLANVYIIEDPLNPENVGTVKKYKFGIKIFEKILAKTHPVNENMKKYNPFDPWGGMNFIINIKGKRRDYSASEWGPVEPLFKKADGTADDDRIEAIEKQLHRLQPALDVGHYKPFDELKKSLERALGTAVEASNEKGDSPKDAIQNSGNNGGAPAATPTGTTTPVKEGGGGTAVEAKQEEVQAPKQESVVKEEPPVVQESGDDEEMAYFQKLLSDG